jgi:2-polyprenyl-3-methyl-5-hydroxy-6-metoxy-1,4-benzoquinol methylase
MHFNRVLQESDYDELQSEMFWLSSLLKEMEDKGLSTALNHVHRRWEYGLAKALVDQRGQELTIIDVGSGASPLGIGLKVAGHDVWETDSCQYGDPVHELRRQCWAYGVEIPWVPQPVEDMPDVPSNTFDVTLCISVMEHVGREQEQAGWRELRRITKPGGLIFATMDFHPDPTIETPFKEIQQTIYNEEHLREVRKWLRCRLLGEPEWEYHGDMVNNYSFGALAVRKPKPRSKKA